MVTFANIFILIACTSAPSVEIYRPLLGQWQAFEQQLKKDALDSATQDLLLLDLAVQEPKFASELCKKVKTRSAKDKCLQVIGRPHLQQQ
mgnify:CR=1 FL=1